MMSQQLQQQQEQQQQQQGRQQDQQHHEQQDGHRNQQQPLAPGAGRPVDGQIEHDETFAPLRNLASQSKSPFVRKHADNLVAWQPLEKATLDRAKRENKPIYMHIGFLANHHCRLTIEESFSNDSVAAFLNEFFIPVVIDREVRPDLDTIYQSYNEALHSQGGWPLNVYLTPDLLPIYSTIYRQGPGDFLEDAKKIQKAWTDEEEQYRAEAAEMLKKLRTFTSEGIQDPDTAHITNPDGWASIQDLELDQIEDAIKQLVKRYDSINGGFRSGTTKFPLAPRLSFLLRLAHFPQQVLDILGEDTINQATDMGLKSLRRIRDGGLHDHLGAGFMRCSLTPDWSLPMFEKMVDFNALLLGIYLDAWLGGKGEKDEFEDVVFELADYLSSSPIRLSHNGFASSEAADSPYGKADRHMRQGAYYLWTRKEFDQVIGGDSTDSQHDALVAALHWNVREDGNIPRELDTSDEFINQNVLCAGMDPHQLSEHLGIPVADVQRILASAKEKLRLHREKERPRPEIDEKVVVSTNGMVISALARTGAAVMSKDLERGQKYVQAAMDAAKLIKENVMVNGALQGYYLDGLVQSKTFAEDYAFLIEGLIDLYEATLDRQWVTMAVDLQAEQYNRFYDKPIQISESPKTYTFNHGFFSNTKDDAILHFKSGMDKNRPSTNSVCVSNLFRLAAISGRRDFLHTAQSTLACFEPEVLEFPFLYVSLLASVVPERLHVAGEKPGGGKLGGVEVVKVNSRDQEALDRYYRSPRGNLRVLKLKDEREVDS